MSSRNRHARSDWKNNVNDKKCPKKGCSGRLIHCQSQYRPQGPINEELECSDCSLVKRDPRFKMNSRKQFFRTPESSVRRGPPVRFAKPAVK